jgi:hypothetical protein
LAESSTCWEKTSSFYVSFWIFATSFPHGLMTEGRAKKKTRVSFESQKMQLIFCMVLTKSRISARCDMMVIVKFILHSNTLEIEKGYFRLF